MDIYVIGVKLLTALLVGGLIGLEREFHDKAAGFRTLTFICLGSTIFTILSLELGKLGDPVRIAAGIVTGIGFIGAGVIIRDGGQVKGLTTASTIWIAAALGMGIGGGYFLAVGLATALILLGLWVLPIIDRVIHQNRETHTYHLTFVSDLDKYQELENLFKEYDLKVEWCNRGARQETMTGTWKVHGHPENHERWLEKIFLDESFLEVSY